MNTNTNTEGRTAVYRQDKKATVGHGGSAGSNQSAYQISRYKHCPNLACGAMFIHESELTNHRKLCNLSKMIQTNDMDGLTQIAKLLAESGLIKLDEWTEVVRHGIRMWRNSEKKLEERMTNKNNQTPQND